MVRVLRLHTTTATYFEKRSGKMISSSYNTSTNKKKKYFISQQCEAQSFIFATEQPSTIYLR